MKRIVSFILGWALSFAALAAAPTIATAIKTGSNITITGANFGAKSTAAPYRFRSWTGLTDGSGSQALAQFDDTEFVNMTAGSSFTVDNSVGFGGGSLKIVANCVAVGGEIFPHHVFSGFSSDTIYMSSWLKVQRVTNNNGLGLSQFKSFRVVQATGGSPTDNYYNGRPMIQMSLSSTEPDENGSFILGSWDASGGRHGDWHNSIYPDEVTYVDMPAFMRDNQAHLVEQVTILNTPASANGVIQVYIDGKLIASYPNMQNKDSSGEHYSYALWGTDFADDMAQNNWVAWESRHYLDVTQARVFLSDSATRAAIATPPFLLPPNAWVQGNPDTITVTDAANIPSGYNYIYVVNSGGEVNSVGYVYTTGGGGGGGNTPVGRKGLNSLGTQTGKRHRQ